MIFPECIWVKMEDVSMDDSADAVSFGFRGLWTPNARDTVEFAVRF